MMGYIRITTLPALRPSPPALSDLSYDCGVLPKQHDLFHALLQNTSPVLQRSFFFFIEYFFIYVLFLSRVLHRTPSTTFNDKKTRKGGHFVTLIISRMSFPFQVFLVQMRRDFSSRKLMTGSRLRQRVRGTCTDKEEGSPMDLERTIVCVYPIG